MNEDEKTSIPEEHPSDLKIRVRAFGSPKIARLLNNTVYGTEGKLRYRQKEIIERMKSQRNIEFIEISKGTRILGTTGIITRQTRTSDTPMNCRYVRYLSVSPGFKNQKRRTKKSKTKSIAKEPKTTGLRARIGEKITEHFEAPFLEENRKGAFYAYVESENINSRNLCLSMGFSPIRKVQTLLFSRFNPKKHKLVSNAGERDRGIIRKKLADFYKTHSLYFEDRIFDTGFYFVFKNDNQILAGIRAIPVHWQVVDYPGFEGWLMRQVLPYAPFTNRLFQPSEFRFLAFDYLFCEQKHVGQISLLMEHACTLLGYHIGMIFGDAETPFIQTLRSSGELGFMHSLFGPVSADLMVRFINADDEYREKIQQNPVFVSALDMT